ncbi:BgTH12-00965 [Blumeria graminis f. sp. triticale]|uniref:Vacuolar ATPase assembly protein VMA22 n=1 Tax=Blumeria graminis f. sp. triticale TaxID=1689686 RepID=A0A9W4D7I4_BLUGR|nr:BgTH12-00965 [Blumeria graminis f. sp. triticale]
MAFEEPFQKSVSLRSQSDKIDCLLVHYLDLIDRYEKLRKSLCKLQSSVLQNISKANFNANRGIRYGEDLYDTRMQALRLCSISKDEKNGTSIFTVDAPTQPDLKIDLEPHDIGTKEHGRETKGCPDKMNENKGVTNDFLVNRNAIRMFGILTPQALRLAQTDSVKMVEEIIPKIATVNAEMIKLEVEIYRACELKAISVSG